MSKKEAAAATIQANIKRLETELEQMQEYQRFCSSKGSLVDYHDLDIARESRIRRKIGELNELLTNSTNKA
jgi:hypothetical protein